MDQQIQYLLSLSLSMCRQLNAFKFRVTTLLTWQTETHLVEISSRIQILESGDLLISNVRESDAGLYTCVRSNEAGTVNGEAYLGVLGKYNKKKQNMQTTEKVL